MNRHRTATVLAIALSFSVAGAASAGSIWRAFERPSAYSSQESDFHTSDYGSRVFGPQHFGGGLSFFDGPETDGCRRGENENAFLGGFRLWDPDWFSHLTP